MKMPNWQNASVPPEKVLGYLLSFSHRIGRHKAAFFARFGFGAEEWNALADALLRHAGQNHVAKREENAFGTRYTIDGPLEAPDGRRPNIRVIWFVERGQTQPRLVTAYPC